MAAPFSAVCGILAGVKNNNQTPVRARWHLAGTAQFDEADLPPDLPWAVLPFDAASRALARQLTTQRLVDGGQFSGTVVPCTVAFGDGPTARHQRGLRRWLARLLNPRSARIRVGKPTDNPKWLQRQFYQGLAAKPESFDALFQSVIAQPMLADLSGDEHRRVRRHLKVLAARPNHTLTRLGDRVLGWFWTRFYSDVEIAGLTPVRGALGDATPVYLSTHRSHLDYLLLSWVLYRARLAVPLVAAGINLNLPLVGSVLRRGGGFFIRRSFQGDPLYPRVVQAYIHSRLLNRQPLEFFPEGGRSRDGLTRTLKLGLLKYVVEAARDPAMPPIALVPVGVAYDRMPDGGGYRYELEGRSKRSEGLADLPKAWRALRSDPLGRVRVSFSPPQRLHRDSALAAVGWAVGQQWQTDMPASAVGQLGLIVPGFAGHRARVSELGRALAVLQAAAGLPRRRDCLDEVRQLGYLERDEGEDAIVYAPAAARDQLSYAAGALRHRALALGLLSIAVLGGASARRTHSLFELAWPSMAPDLYLDADWSPPLDAARNALAEAGLLDPKPNANYRLLAALAEPVVPAVTRMLAILRQHLDAPDAELDEQLARAHDGARDALLLSGRSELNVLDIKAYRRFVVHLDDIGARVDGRLTRRARRTASRLLLAFEQLDRQFVI